MAITHNASTITITGYEDSDTLKAYVTANSLGTVSGALLHLSPARNIDVQGDFVSYNTTYSGATFRGSLVTPLTAIDFGYSGDYGPVEGGAIIISTGVSNQGFQKRGGYIRFYGTKVMLVSNVRSDLGSSNADTAIMELNGASIERYGAGSCIFYAKGARFFGDPVTIYNLTTALQNPEGVSIETELRIRNCQTAISAASSDALLMRDVIVGTEVVRDIQTKYYSSFVRGNLRKENMWFLFKGSGSDFRDEPYIKSFAAVKLKFVDELGDPLSGVTFYSRDDAGLFVPDESGVSSINLKTSNVEGLITETLIPRWSAFYSEQNPPVTSTSPVNTFNDHTVETLVCNYGYYPQLATYANGTVPDFGDRSTSATVPLVLDELIRYEYADALLLTYPNIGVIDTLDKLHAAIQAWSVQASNLASVLDIGFNPSNAVAGVGIDFGDLNLVFDYGMTVFRNIEYNNSTRTLSIKCASTLNPSEGLSSITTAGTISLGSVSGSAPEMNVSYTDSSGTVSILNIVANAIPSGASVRLYNETKEAEVSIDMNIAVAGFTKTIRMFTGADVEVGDTLRLDAFKADGTVYSKYYSSSNVAAAGTWNIITPWEEWAEANALNINGSAVLDFQTDYENIEIDIVEEPMQMWLGKELVGFILYKTASTEEGMRKFFGGLRAQNAARWVVEVNKVNLKIDNLGSGSADQMDEVIISRSDGSGLRRSPTTGGGGIGIAIANDVASLIPTSEALAVQVSTDLTPKLAVINTGVQKASLLVPHTDGID